MFSDCFRLSTGNVSDRFYHSHCARFHWECRVLCDRLDTPLTDRPPPADRSVGFARRFGLRRQYCPWNDFLVINSTKQGDDASSLPFRWVVLLHFWYMAVLLNSYKGVGRREEYEKTKPSIKPPLDVVFTVLLETIRCCFLLAIPRFTGMGSPLHPRIRTEIGILRGSFTLTNP